MSEERLISEPRPIVERVLYQGDDEPRYGPTLATLVGDGHGAERLGRTERNGHLRVPVFVVPV